MERQNPHYGMGFIPPPPAPFQSHPRRAALGVNEMLNNHHLAPNQPGNEAARMYHRPFPTLPPPYPTFPSLENPYLPPRPQYFQPTNYGPPTWPNPFDSSANLMTHQSQPYNTMARPPFYNPYSSTPLASRELPPPVFTHAAFGEGAHRLKINRSSKPCMICLETFDVTETENHFPYKCLKCTTGHYCKGCLKDWFLSATQNESKMPPKCCSIVPLSAVKDLLSSDQMELYKAKFEEWATPDRLYCPVPQCSTFIPPRLYLEFKKPPRGLSAQQNRESKVLGFPNSPANPFTGSKESKTMKPHVLCPTCGCSVCTGCHQITHIGNCPESDLDPILEEQLKKWKIKRCPKCRAGVRKVFGCAHVECRCGAHFCFECLKPINECDGSGCEDGSDEEQAETFEEDDLDGRAGFYEGDGHEFGPEPYGNVIDAWGCQHRWTELRLREARALECNRCFKHVHALEAETNTARTTNEDVEMGGMEWPVNVYGTQAWRCFSGHIMCTRCSRRPSQFRVTDPSYLWMCDCGTTCKSCDIGQAMEKFNSDQLLASQRKARDDSMAWECRCGMVLCGGCKDAHTNL